MHGFDKYTSVYPSPSACIIPHSSTGVNRKAAFSMQLFFSSLQLFRPCCHTQLAPAPASAWVLALVAGVAVQGLSARPCLPQLTASELAYKIRILYNCPWQLAALPGLQNSSILYNWVSLLRRAQLGVIAQLRGWPSAVEKESCKYLKRDNSFPRIFSMIA